MNGDPESPPEALYHDAAFAGLYDAQNSDDARGGRPDFASVRARAGGARSVLDLGCGTGELAVSLAPGREVVGVDPAEAMLAQARARPGGNAVEWVLADARSLDLGRRFDLIALTGHAFQCFLTDEDIGALLATARRHLAPDGSLVFDSRNPATRYWEGWTPELTGRSFETPDGMGRRETTATHDPRTSIVTYTQRYRLPGGAERETQARLRSATRGEIEALAKAQGLRIVEVLGDWTGAAWREDSPEIVVVAAPA
jgi:SAM-dependent methyltransferase